MSADALQASIESLDRDGRLLALMEKLNRHHADEIESLHAELAELRDGLLALSNRIESVTRAVAMPRGGLYAIPFQTRRVTRYCFECEQPRRFTEGKCDHCAAPLQAEAEPR